FPAHIERRADSEDSTRSPIGFRERSRFGWREPHWGPHVVIREIASKQAPGVLPDDPEGFGRRSHGAAEDHRARRFRLSDKQRELYGMDRIPLTESREQVAAGERYGFTPIATRRRRQATERVRVPR